MARRVSTSEANLWIFGSEGPQGSDLITAGPNRPGQHAQDLQGRLRPPIRLYIK
jgi:hypothetical protein